MSHSKSLSNYDNNFINMIKESKLLIIDLDGTLIDFEKIDNAIIKELFSGNSFISIVDKILWKVNKLDVLGNGYARIKA